MRIRNLYVYREGILSNDIITSFSLKKYSFLHDSKFFSFTVNGQIELKENLHVSPLISQYTLVFLMYVFVFVTNLIPLSYELEISDSSQYHKVL